MLRISAAPAQVARKRFLDLVLSWIGVVVQQRLGGDDETGRAIATLQSVMLDVGIDQRMLGGGDPFDGFDVAAVTLARQRHAGEDWAAIEDDGTRPARSSVAKRLGARQAQPVMDEMV